MSNNKSFVIEFQTSAGKKLKGENIALDHYFTDDAEWHLPQSLDQLSGGAHRIGKQAVLALFEGTVARFYKPETMSFDFHSMIAEGDYVHMHFTLNAETVHGEPYNNSYQTLFQLRDGKIFRVWEYFDAGTLLQLFSAIEANQQ